MTDLRKNDNINYNFFAEGVINMPKFVLICGPQAVGKMTVGQELSKITNLKLLHNHMTIELLLKIFEHGTLEFRELDKLFRMEIFKKVAESDLEGIIFTWCWAFDLQEDWQYIDEIFTIFRKKHCEIIIVELETTLEERLKRNTTSNRLQNKPSKRNLEWSQKEILRSMDKYRLNSYPDEIKEKNYLKIDNTKLSPEEVAHRIKDKFKL